jgi:hypothetical protein
MQPIVNGLQEEYDGRVAFVQIDAQSADGETLFRQLGLLGHPSILIYSTDGEPVYRGYGIIEAELLRQEVAQLFDA